MMQSEELEKSKLITIISAAFNVLKYYITMMVCGRESFVKIFLYVSYYSNY